MILIPTLNFPRIHYIFDFKVTCIEMMYWKITDIFGNKTAIPGVIPRRTVSRYGSVP